MSNIDDVAMLLKEVERLQMHYEASQEALGETMHELTGARKEVKQLQAMLREAPANFFAHKNTIVVWNDKYKTWLAKRDELLKGKEE